MKYKVYLKSSLPFFIVFILYLLLITLLSYFNVLGYKTISIMSYIFSIMFFLLSGFKTARKTSKRGYLSGLFMGLILVILMMLLSLILGSGIKIKALIYYGTLILSSVIGGMVGINAKKQA